MNSNTKELIESAIRSLTNGDSISNIMLKTQAIAHYLENKKFENWTKLELRGYGETDDLPEYRKIVCGVKIRIANPLTGEELVKPIPPDSIQDEKINERLYIIAIKQPLSEIESLIQQCENTQNHTFTTKIPAYVFQYFKSIFRSKVLIQDAWQYAEISSLKVIIDNVKSVLLESFQELDDTIDFTAMDNTKKIDKIINQTINAGIIDTNCKQVDINNSTIIGGNQNTVTINDQLKSKIETILKQIEEVKSNIKEDEEEIAQYIYEIRQELEKDNSSGNLIKKSLRALKSFKAIVISEAIELGIDKLITLIPS